MSTVSGRQSSRVAVIFVASTVNVNQKVQRTKTHHAEARFGALHLLIFFPFWLQILPPLKQLVVRPVNDIGLKHTSTQKKGPYLLIRSFQNGEYRSRTGDLPDIPVGTLQPAVLKQKKDRII